MNDASKAALTVADALGCFWNAFIGDARRSEDATALAVASCLSEGFAAVAARLSEGLQAAAAPEAPAPVVKVEPLDDIAEMEISSRALALLQRKGWAPGGHISGRAAQALLVEFGTSLLRDPPTDRCGHPDCGCDQDARCAVSFFPDALAAARAEGVRAGLERAAKLCEHYAGIWEGEPCEHATELASSILLLKEEVK